MKFWTKTVLAILPALMLLGCGTSGEVEEASDTGVSSSSTTTSDSGSEASTSGIGSDSETGSEGMADSDAGFQGGDAMNDAPVDALDDPSSLLATRVIYFDYDRSDLRSDVRAVIMAHAVYLANNSNMSITLEGHADERGTREYNIALGERRANAVERMLTLQGAAASQIRVVSYGEERPAALGHEEAAWSLNRRAEFIYNR
ncbi:peptidoglycan-associated lipoprotein Pal [Beggiatoa alba]|nr:peptidoglycan-associated lipoprotein Pal [Beggiatoa alba]